MLPMVLTKNTAYEILNCNYYLVAKARRNGNVTKRAKLVQRFLSMPTDFTYDETVRLLNGFGYEEIVNDGSRRAFINKTMIIM